MLLIPKAEHYCFKTIYVILLISPSDTTRLSEYIHNLPRCSSSEDRMHAELNSLPSQIRLCVRVRQCDVSLETTRGKRGG